MAQESTGHLSGVTSMLQGTTGTERAGMVADKIRHASTL
jgi:hypothetical protein